eukprot:7378521-Prymnesium_polylepis.1
MKEHKWAKVKERAVTDAENINAQKNKLFYRWMAEGSLTVAFFLLFLIYPSTSQNILYAFQCMELDDGSNLLRIDLSIDCDGTAHWFFWCYAIVMTLVYPLGIPSLYYILLRSEASALNGLQSLEKRIKANEAQQANEAQHGPERSAIQSQHSFSQTLQAPEQELPPDIPRLRGAEGGAQETQGPLRAEAAGHARLPAQARGRLRVPRLLV